MFLFLNSVHSHHRNISKRLFSLKLNNDVRILPMPRLSPTMKKGTIKKWFLSQGDQVKSYQLILEVSTSELTKDSLETAKEFTMEIEILEEMYLVKKLGIEGKEYSVGECIGLFSDEEKYITQFDSLKIENCPEDAYKFNQGTQMVLWQAYAKAESLEDSDRCSCG